jgi:hypothetical protein
VEEAAMLVRPDLDAEGLARAREFLNGPECAAVLKVMGAIDTGDMGVSVYSGLKSAWSLLFGDKSKALDVDPQQGADAALKALALAWCVWKLMPGSPTERIQRFRALPAGEALLTWFAAIEIALPFADDTVLGAGAIVSGLVRKYGSNIPRLEMFAGPGSLDAATGMLGTLSGPLDEIVRAVGKRTTEIAGAAQRFLPQALATAGTVAGAAATAADLLPVYRYLGARVCVEAALERAATAS